MFRLLGIRKETILIPTIFGAFQQSFNDIRYIHPIIEYQKLVHLNWGEAPRLGTKRRFWGRRRVQCCGVTSI